MAESNAPAQQYCEVYDEPRHRFHLQNEFVNVYEIELPRACSTQFHRHCEDTVYFVVADADLLQSFPDRPAERTTASFGGTLCRAHHDEPLIHQVTNLGNSKMHMVGAEALKKAPTTRAAPLALIDHVLSWESPRFRVYDVSTVKPTTAYQYQCFGLFVALTEGLITLGGANEAGNATVKLRAGNFVWIEPNVSITPADPIRGIFAEWI